MALTPTLSQRERGQCRIVLGAQPTLIGLVATRIQPCEWHIAVRLVDVADDTRSAPLLDQAHALPDELSGSKGVVLGDSSAERVVVESRCLRVLLIGARPSGGADLDESALVIPAEGLRRVPTTELLDQAPMPVIEEALVFKDPNEVVFNVAGLAVLGALVDRLLRGVVQDVARRVVLEGFAVGCWQAGLGKGLPCRFLDPSGGVRAMAGIAIQAVAALAQFALTEKAFCLGRPAAV